jgi:16S rRNA (cytosine967-C5)-methyltransferase
MKDTGLPARKAALSILSGVLQKRRPLDAQLEQLSGLEVRDAGFARALVSQTLRHMGALDAVLRKFMAKPLAPHKAQYGAGTARQIARAHQSEAPIDIVLKAAGATHPESAALFGMVRRLSDEGRIDTMAGFAQGHWWVQDAAASLPATLLGDVRGQRVIDLCAAPGGKTMQLAAMGAQVTAVEIDAARAERIRENLARTRLEAEIIQADARDVEITAPFVLIDAPCTATGTIRRHPDLPWIKGAADVTVSAGAAYEILLSGAAMVEAGGTLVFAVCSLEREEGEEQIAAFLSSHPDFARLPLTKDDVFGHEGWITPEGDLRTLPFMLDGMDGFYAARLQRRPSA